MYAFLPLSSLLCFCRVSCGVATGEWDGVCSSDGGFWNVFYKRGWGSETKRRGRHAIASSRERKNGRGEEVRSQFGCRTLAGILVRSFVCHLDFISSKRRRPGTFKIYILGIEKSNRTKPFSTEHTDGSVTLSAPSSFISLPSSLCCYFIARWCPVNPNRPNPGPLNVWIGLYQVGSPPSNSLAGTELEGRIEYRGMFEFS